MFRLVRLCWAPHLDSFRRQRRLDSLRSLSQNSQSNQDRTLTLPLSLVFRDN